VLRSYYPLSGLQKGSQCGLNLVIIGATPAYMALCW
jgi:hypothetical protein